jgi:hypothetical protein
VILEVPVILRDSLRPAKSNQKARSAAGIQVSGIGRTEQNRNLEWIKRPISRAIRERAPDGAEFVAQTGDRPPVAVRNFPEERSNRLPQVGIFDQVVLGTSFMTPGSERQTLGLLGVQDPQALLDCHAFDLRRRARELFCGGDALQVFPQIGRQGILPAGAFLELGETAGPSGEAEAQVVEQEDRSEREGLQRIERIVRTGDQVRHLPQGVKMGDVVDSEVGQVAVDLVGERRRPFAELEQGSPQPLPRLGVGVRGRLRGQGPANQRVVGEVHDSG